MHYQHAPNHYCGLNHLISNLLCGIFSIFKNQRFFCDSRGYHIILSIWKDELEADLALEKQIDELENEETEGSNFGLSEELMNRKFAAKIDRGEFNERTYKQCIADELLKDCLKTLTHKLWFIIRGCKFKSEVMGVTKKR